MNRGRKRIHLVGIGGVGMAALAHLLCDAGHAVSGSDVEDGAFTGALRARGVPLHLHHDADHVPEPCDLLIHSAAVPPENPERERARAAGVPEQVYAEALGDLMEARVGVAVAGSHGKTGTTALLLHALERAGLEPGGIVGGQPCGRPHNAYLGGGPFVAEACEYRGSFLRLHPKAAVLTGVDWDHPDCYADRAEALAAFGAFVDGVGGPVVTDAATARALGRGDLVIARDVVRVGTLGPGRVRLQAPGFEGDGPFALTVPHGVRQANLVAALLITFFDRSPAQALEALDGFRGVVRRLEHFEAARGVTVVNDYAHHPREIEVTRRAVGRLHPGRRILAVFQSHHQVRTRVFAEAFARSLARFPRLVLVETYNVTGRDGGGESSGRDLEARLRDAGASLRFARTPAEASGVVLEDVRDGDVVLVMGAGDVESVAHDVVRQLR